jgi:Outer membrane protein beta-barrel domain
MSTLNDNHIDDLMRRASEKYPLRTDSADWDRLADALEKDPSLILPPVQEDGDGRRRRRFFWLFLLLPLGGLGYYAWHSGSHHSTSQQAIVRLPQAPAAGVSTPSATQPGANPMTGANPTTGATPISGTDTKSGASQMSGTNMKSVTNAKSGTNTKSGTNALPGASLSPGVNPPSAASAGQGGAISANPANAIAVNPPASEPAPDRSHAHGRKNMQQMPGGQISNSTGDNSTGKHNKSNGQGARSEGKTGSPRDGEASNAADGVLPNVPVGTMSNIAEGTWAQQDPLSRNLNLQRALITGDPSTDIKAQFPLPGPANLAKPGDPGKDTALAKTKKAKNKRLPFYYGILAAPDLSMVKYQSVKGVGYTAGILLGYNINSKLAIETGVYLDKKKYYTDGEYFNKKNIPFISPSFNLENVNGSCNMVEIPINFRYNLNNGGKIKWFATAGTSTYFMSKEAYSYNYLWNGNEWPGSYSYKAPSQYWFSEINLSLGFERTLGKIGQLRIEPYWKIPTSGIGKGDLPVMSAGLNIGITRKIW